MLPTVLPAGHRGSASLVRALLLCTAMALLVSPALAAFAGAAHVGLGGSPELAVGGGALGLLALIERLIRGGRDEERPLAQRRLELPPPDLELELASTRAPAGAERIAPGDEPDRPAWVRRLEASTEPPALDAPVVPFGDDWEGLATDGPAGATPPFDERVVVRD